MGKRLPAYFHCPTEFTLAVLDGKWKTVILGYLKERPCRYADLRKLVPRLSDKVLSERLHDLTSSGLVVREAVTGRTQSYSLSEKGRSLSDLLQHLYSWGFEHAGSFGVRVGAPLEELDAERSKFTRAATRPFHNSSRGPRQLAVPAPSFNRRVRTRND
jgi:DNA-binding HxlR family transcriptional regulator